MSNEVRELTMDELETVSGGGLDDLGDIGQMDSMRLQMLMDRRSKAFESLSNIMKKTSDTNSRIIGNLK